jgi:hypothetical protein
MYTYYAQNGANFNKTFSYNMGVPYGDFGQPKDGGHCIIGLQKVDLLRNSSYPEASWFDFTFYGSEIGDITYNNIWGAGVQTTCFSVCPAGTYYANQYCATCNIVNCVACAAATICLKCIPGLTPNMTNYYASCACPDRQYYNFGASACQACPYDCLTCDATGKCLTCNYNDHRQLNTSTARCDPVAGYYDGGATVASSCLNNCENCTSATTCTGCFERYVLALTAPPHCDACPYDCYRCDNSGDCT